MKTWRLYERFIARLMSERSGDDVTVIPNAKVRGCISKIVRQVDILIDSRHYETIERRIIVDAKCYREKVDIKDVEAFEGMMRDCRAHRGIIVCPKGFTPAALKRAQQTITIMLVPLNELEKLDLDTWDLCLGACSSGKRRYKNRGMVLWDSPYGLATGDSPLHITAYGKCDVCSNFNIWCWDCGTKLALADEDEQKCNCKWFWLTAIEDDSDPSSPESFKAVHLYFILLPGMDLYTQGLTLTHPMILHVDRRPLE